MIILLLFYLNTETKKNNIKCINENQLISLTDPQVDPQIRLILDSEIDNRDISDWNLDGTFKWNLLKPSSSNFYVDILTNDIYFKYISVSGNNEYLSKINYENYLNYDMLLSNPRKFIDYFLKLYKIYVDEKETSDIYWNIC